MTRNWAGLALGVLAMGAVTGCGAIYTSPGVEDGSFYGSALDDLAVDIVPLTFESTAAANLTPYVPARLPLGFSPDAVKNIVAGTNVTPPSMALPAPPTQPNPRPGFIADRMPPIREPDPYRIGIADVLLLSVNTTGTSLDQLPGLITAQSKRQGFVVQDDGAIAIPDAGRVRVAGLTMQDAESVIFQALVGAGIDPTFSLEIAEFNSQRVSVGGKVRNPTLVPITLKPLYLHEAVDSAGGLAVSDPRVAKVQLFRGGETYQISAERFQSDPAVRQIVLQDGDSIFVEADYLEERARASFEERMSLATQRRAETEFGLRIAQLNAQVVNDELEKLKAEREIFKDRVELGAVKRDYAYLAGEVVLPQSFELPFENKLVMADVLFGERGIDINFGDYGEIYVLRRSTNPEEPNRVTAYHLDATNAANLVLASSMEIHAGDIVFVAEQPVTAWNRMLTQIFPSIFSTATAAATRF